MNTTYELLMDSKTMDLNLDYTACRVYSGLYAFVIGVFRLLPIW